MAVREPYVRTLKRECPINGPRRNEQQVAVKTSCQAITRQPSSKETVREVVLTCLSALLLLARAVVPTDLPRASPQLFSRRRMRSLHSSVTAQ